MPYQVLALKWRPKNFQELVGQMPIVTALSNSFDQNRLHHAYLLTGSHGVGKTTIARIIAKCLNCEQGISSRPCGTCLACEQIKEGRFVDLIEVDAASRTKVEDMRELLDNVPYAPTQGRYKIYLIDEIHMLSNHSFNALLKTVEEPPPHAIFIFATTDPEKIPTTILSRCLQFSLRLLSPEQIQQQLIYILTQEAIPYEEAAVTLLAESAEGSMRDALSLLDQAIGYGAGKVTLAGTQQLLGSVNPITLPPLLTALLNRDFSHVYEWIADQASYGIEWMKILEAFLHYFHRIAVHQALANSGSPEKDEQIILFSQQINPELLQLFYQILLVGRQDLPLAPSARLGFEMLMLRLMSFHPHTVTLSKESVVSVSAPASAPTGPTPSSANLPPVPATEDTWKAIIPKLDLKGTTLLLAQQCVLKQETSDFLSLTVPSAYQTLLNTKQKQLLVQALQAYYQHPIHVTIELANETSSPSPVPSKVQPPPTLVQNILDTFNATLVDS